MKDAKSPAMCTLNNLRRVTRIIAKTYDSALQPVELKSTQFSLLSTLNHYQDIPLSKLAEYLVMDRTTLTRNLKPLITRGLIESKTELDKRYRIINLTKQGLQLLNEAEPLWQVAQMSLVEKQGADNWSELIDGLTSLAKAVK